MSRLSAVVVFASFADCCVSAALPPPAARGAERARDRRRDLHARDGTDHTMGIIEETEAKLAALRLRLPELEGKANKKERTAVSKEIYSLENDEAYCAAVKANLEGSRAQAAAADDEAHQAKLKAEAEEEEARRAAAEARAAAGPAEPQPDEDEESHLEILERTIKGDGKTTPAPGDYVYCTYTGKFAEGTEHGGVDYSGKVSH